MTMTDQVTATASVAVRTQRVPVRVFTRAGAVIQGHAHVKPGAQQRRLSDVLNLSQVRYVAVTEATYSVPGESPVTTACVLVNTADITMVDVDAEEPGVDATPPTPA